MTPWQFQNRMQVLYILSDEEWKQKQDGCNRILDFILLEVMLAISLEMWVTMALVSGVGVSDDLATTDE